MYNNYDQFAFPKQVPDGDNIQSGLTKREWFAGMALQGLLANPDILKNKNATFDTVGSAAIKYADEILKQL